MPESTYLGSRGSPRVKGLQGKSENHGLRDVAIKVSDSTTASVVYSIISQKKTPELSYFQMKGFNPMILDGSASLMSKSHVTTDRTFPFKFHESPSIWEIASCGVHHASRIRFI
ncbi:hypothetical protein HZH68_013852 [Vespula germanica]|uniref:Uncharacterized protein n=1 Tax=Vespula germanica TaxID=30212 RepID=A0A834JE15_VESGE|nr:hypothetical protein HZH68_013852 [Vespula germanica]